MNVIQDFSSNVYSDTYTTSNSFSSEENNASQLPPALTKKKSRQIKVSYPNGITYEGFSVNGSFLGKGRIIEFGGRKVTNVRFQPGGGVIIKCPNGVTKTCRINRGELETTKVKFPSGAVFIGTIENEDLGEAKFSGEGELIDLNKKATYAGKFRNGVEYREDALTSTERKEGNRLQSKRTAPACLKAIKPRKISNRKIKLAAIEEIDRLGKSAPSKVIAVTRRRDTKEKPRSPEDEFEERRQRERDNFLIVQIEKRRSQFARERSLQGLANAEQHPSSPETTVKCDRISKVCSFFHRFLLNK